VTEPSVRKNPPPATIRLSVPSAKSLLFTVTFVPAIGAEKYTIVIGDNHYHAIFTGLFLLYIAIRLTNWYYKPAYHVSELVDRFFYLKQKFKCQEHDISLIFDAIEIRDKKFKTMEAKVRKLERELKKYD
jgi:hypothetical protein